MYLVDPTPNLDSQISYSTYGSYMVQCALTLTLTNILLLQAAHIYACIDMLCFICMYVKITQCVDTIELLKISSHNGPKCILTHLRCQLQCVIYHILQLSVDHAVQDHTH